MTTVPDGAIPEAARPLRADARRNRERIIKAARAVFGEQGVDAQIDDVARRAKVGVGTVYRHFPTKEALLDAIVREHFAVITGLAQAALANDDPWEGFRTLVWQGAEHNATDRAFSEAVAMTDKSAIAAECGLSGMTHELMERAKAQGKLRRDATQADVPLIMIGASAIMGAHPSPLAWRRYIELMLDGLRAS